MKWYSPSITLHLLAFRCHPIDLRYDHGFVVADGDLPQTLESNHMRWQLGHDPDHRWLLQLARPSSADRCVWNFGASVVVVDIFIS